MKEQPPVVSSKPQILRLDSWKEIAAYRKRGARSVQRWEREEGLPVHRLPHEKLGSVYAYSAELDTWWKSRSTETPALESPPRQAPSIAVLPFADMSQAGDQAYFCEGIAEEIINSLSGIVGLRVASRTSSFRIRPPTGDSREIGRQLGVRTLLEGSVRKSGGKLRITVQLKRFASAGMSSFSELWRELDQGATDVPGGPGSFVPFCNN